MRACNTCTHSVHGDQIFVYRVLEVYCPDENGEKKVNIKNFRDVTLAKVYGDQDMNVNSIWCLLDIWAFMWYMFYLVSSNLAYSYWILLYILGRLRMGNICALLFVNI